MTKPLAAVIGVGPGTGGSLARRFASGGYTVALLARSEASTNPLAAELGKSAISVQVDATDPDSVRQALEQAADIADRPITALLYNAGSGVWGSIEAVDMAGFETSWRTNTLGLAAAAQTVAPGMRDAGGGSIIVTGATAAAKHGARAAAFTSAKSAQRALAMSMAKHFGPDGIHVAYMVIDGAIDTPKSKAKRPDIPDEAFLKSTSIAETAFALAHQDRSAWTFEIDLRPHVEPW